MSWWRFCYRNIDKKCEINVPQDFFSRECFLLFKTCKTSKPRTAARATSTLARYSRSANGGGAGCSSLSQSLFCEDSEGKDKRGTLTRRDLLPIPSFADHRARRHRHLVRDLRGRSSWHRRLAQRLPLLRLQCLEGRRRRGRHQLRPSRGGLLRTAAGRWASGGRLFWSWTMGGKTRRQEIYICEHKPWQWYEDKRKDSNY